MLVAVQHLKVGTTVLVLLENVVQTKCYVIVMASSLLFCIFTKTKGLGILLAESIHCFHRKRTICWVHFSAPAPEILCIFISRVSTTYSV